MAPTVTICGLGPGGVGLVTEQTRQAIEEHDSSVSFVRTRRHPTSSLLADGRSFDDVYDAGETLDDVYRTIADAVGAAAREHGNALYAVPGSPLILERAVHHLRARSDIDIRLLPAVSFLDATWASLAVDPVESAVRLVDGHTFARDAAGQTGPLLVAHAHAPWVLSDIKLAIDAGPEQKVLILQRLGTTDECITEVAWPDLDRSVVPDHLTSLYLPTVTAPVAHDLQRSVELMHRLRQECPWDQEQTHASLGRYLIEEAYEVLEAIDEVESGVDDAHRHLEEELGDLWFQILFHAELAAEAGEFSIADVARTAYDKLVGRHPHVFGDVEAADAAAVATNWEAIKKVEKGRDSVMDGIPGALPALIYAEKILKKGSRVGAPDESAVLLAAIAAGLTPEATAGDVGQLLLALVGRSRELGVDAEAALRTASNQARERFQQMESAGQFDRWILG